MGAWSHEPFGNDTANDWAYGLEEAHDLSYIEATLDKILDVGTDYIESPDAEEAIAAIEVLAKLLSRGTQVDAYTEKIDVWVKKSDIKPSPELRSKAQQVLQRLVSENSELFELWVESESGDEWKKSIAQLGAAIGA